MRRCSERINSAVNKSIVTDSPAQLATQSVQHARTVTKRMRGARAHTVLRAKVGKELTYYQDAVMKITNKQWT